MSRLAFVVVLMCAACDGTSPLMDPGPLPLQPVDTRLIVTGQVTGIGGHYVPGAVVAIEPLDSVCAAAVAPADSVPINAQGLFILDVRAHVVPQPACIRMRITPTQYCPYRADSTRSVVGRYRPVGDAIDVARLDRVLTISCIP